MRNIYIYMYIYVKFECLVLDKNNPSTVFEIFICMLEHVCFTCYIWNVLFSFLFFYNIFIRIEIKNSLVRVCVCFSFTEVEFKFRNGLCYLRKNLIIQINEGEKRRNRKRIKRLVSFKSKKSN